MQQCIGKVQETPSDYKSKTGIPLELTKKHMLKYTKLPTKLVITKPWEALCIDLIGPYSLKGKDEPGIDFMCLTMIDPASNWFEIVELLVTTDAVIPMDTKGQRVPRHIIILSYLTLTSHQQ